MTASATPLVTPLGTPVLTRATSGSVTGTWGTGQNRVAGNVLVAAVTAGGSTASAAAISTPSGWTQAGIVSNTATTANAWAAIYTKVATGADSAPAFTATLSGTAAMTVTLFELAAGNCITPADTSGTYASGGTAGTLSAMTVTTTSAVSAAGEYAIAVFAQEAAAATNTWNHGSGWTNAVSDGTTSSVLHTAVDYYAAPAAGSALSETGHWTTDASAFGAGLILVIAPTGPGIELYTENAVTTVTSGGSTTPASGTAEIWTVASSASFPAVSLTAFPPTRFHFADTTSAAAAAETMAALAVNSTTWIVMRGAEGTTPVSHSGTFTIQNVVTASALQAPAQQYNVRSLIFQGGAVGNGVADDTAAIQAALTAARLAGAGTVWVPEGTYLVSSILQIGSGVTLAGAGKGVTTIRMKSGSWSGVAQVGSNTGISVLQVYDGAAASYITVTGITFDGNQTGITAIPAWANTPSCSPLSLLDVTGVTISNCQVINAIGYSLYLYGCASFQVTQCLVLSGQVSAAQGWGTPTQQDGIHVSASQYGIIAGNIVDTGTLGGIGDDGIALQSWGTGTSAITGVAVCGNTIRAAAAGIDLAMSGGPISNVTISGNVIWAALGAGVKTSPFAAGTSIVSNVTISGNTLGAVASGNSGDAAIELLDYTMQGSSGQGWQDIAISGNTIASCVNTGGAAIYVGQGYGLTINGNTLDGLDTEGGIQIGNNGGTSCPVNNFTVTGNTVNMAATAGSGPAGIVVFDSHDGTITGNTAIGVHGGGSVGVLLIGVSGTNLITGVTVGPNRLTGWDTGVQEQNSGAQPDYNLIADNILHNCTAGIVTTGLHTLSQQPTPDIGGVTLTEQFTALASSYTLTNSTSAQKIFNATAAGTITVPAATLFFFELVLDITGLSSSSHTIDLSFAGTATVTSAGWQALTATAAGGAVSSFALSAGAATGIAATAITAATTGTVLQAVVKGTIRTNAAGTLIPQITQATASAAAVVAAGSYIRLTPVGTNTSASAGNWS